MYSLELTEKIYYKQTREQLDEILASYYSGNYRSAVVMLYSAVLSDLCLKLNELNEIEGDIQAQNILETTILKTKESCKSKSEWERMLVEEMNKKGYLSDKAKSDIDALYNDRCFSAHPALNEKFELVKPTKEMTLAHIVNMISEIFIEPPYFCKNIASKIADDLKEKKEVLENRQKLHRYLETRYFSRMNNSSLLSVFKSFWKFCFNSKDDAECHENWAVNLTAMLFIVSKYESVLFEAKGKKFDFPVANEKTCISNLFILCAENKNVFNCLQDTTKDLLKKNDAQSTNYLISWFLYDSFDDYIKHLKDTTWFGWNDAVGDVSFRKLKEKCELENQLGLFIDFCIKIFTSIDDFYHVKDTYDLCIRPNLASFSVLQLERIIDGICKSRVISDCWEFTKIEYNEIAKMYVEKSGQKIDRSKNTSFRCSDDYCYLREKVEQKE